MRYLFAILALAVAAVLLGYVGLVTFNVSSFFYENYPVDLSNISMANGWYTLIALTSGSLILGAVFLIAGICAVSKTPERKH
jgi:hypothetical protein